MPNQVSKIAKLEHILGRIPGAVFFDIDEISDHNTDLPHMLPSEEEFIKHMKRLQIRKNDDIVWDWPKNILFFADEKLLAESWLSPEDEKAFYYLQ